MSQRRHIPGRCYASAAVCQAKKPPFFLRGESVVEIALQGSEIVTGWLQSAYGIMESLSF